jgi:hypothetical protein
MALDNSFYLEISEEPNQIKSWMIENLDFQESEDQTAIVKKGVTAVVDFYKPHFNVVEETYDFVPNVSVYFRLDKFEAFDDGFINMVQSVQSILENFSCQAILLGPGGETSLLYKKRKLILQKSEWTGANLALFDMPYVVKEIINM